jgi:excisionase family DNA binding protein
MGLIHVNGFQKHHETMPLAVGHREAARLLGVSERKLYTMVKDREVFPSRLGGRNVFIVEDLKRLLESRRNLE